MYTVMVGKPNGTDKIRMTTLAEGVGESKKIELDAPREGAALSPGEPKWANYVKGVIQHFPGKYVRNMYEHIS